MTADKEKRKPAWQPSGLQWAGGAALCLLGLGAYVLREEPTAPSHRPLTPPGLADLPGLEPLDVADAAAPAAGSESLEDALRSLETGSEPPPMEAFKKVSRSAKKQQPKAQDQKKAKAVVSDFVEGAMGTDSKAAEEILEKALKEAQAKKKAKKAKASDEDTKKARAIINDAMKKLKLGEGEEDSEIKKRLEALLAGEDDAPAGDDTQRAAPAKEAPAPQEDDAHLDFVKLLKEEQSRKHEHTLPKVKSEFTEHFGGDGRSLLCQGCKLVAARFGSELDNHDVHESENPALMLASKRRALDATCQSFRHLHVVSTEGGLRFEAGEAPSDGPGVAGASQRLCAALLEETRFEVMTKLIQTKMPSLSMMGQQKSAKHNWERWLCAQRTRTCKRSEVREDDEEDEEL